MCSTQPASQPALRGSGVVHTTSPAPPDCAHLPGSFMRGAEFSRTVLCSEYCCWVGLLGHAVAERHASLQLLVMMGVGAWLRGWEAAGEMARAARNHLCAALTRRVRPAAVARTAAGWRARARALPQPQWLLQQRLATRALSPPTWHHPHHQHPLARCWPAAALHPRHLAAAYHHQPHQHRCLAGVMAPRSCAAA
jgi:hypothetical protein